MKKTPNSIMTIWRIELGFNEYFLYNKRIKLIISLFSTGFTPLILAATAGHVGVVEVLLDKGGDIEAQSERTKDTPLSLACSGGRQEVNAVSVYPHGRDVFCSPAFNVDYHLCWKGC